MPKPPAYLQQDMTVSVDIEVARRPQSLWLPLTAVQTAGSAGAEVWVLRDQRLHRQSVTLGLRHQGRVAVLSGLDAGERLATQPALHWQEGLRVRAVPP